jgi:hypothetical protein
MDADKIKEDHEPTLGYKKQIHGAGGVCVPRDHSAYIMERRFLRAAIPSTVESLRPRLGPELPSKPDCGCGSFREHLSPDGLQ